MSKQECPDCSWKPGLKSPTELCPTCKGSGTVKKSEPKTSAPKQSSKPKPNKSKKSKK